MLPLLVIADDRTGALETAGELAERLRGAVTVTVGRRSDHPVSVVDIASRHLPGSVAAARLDGLGLDRWDGRLAHKLDSLLRGNWAAELAALGAAGGRRIVVVPAFPAMDRLCVDGVVRAGGVPVDQLADARRAAATARPAASLGAVELQVGGVPGWLAGSAPVAVCDAASDADLAAIAAHLADHTEVIVSGTAAVLAALAAAIHPSCSANVDAQPTFADHPGGVGRDGRAGHATHPTCSANVDARPTFADHPGGGRRVGRAVVVLGSVHPVALAQASAAEALPGVTVVRTDRSAGSTPDELLDDLAGRARPCLDGADLIVMVGGDTAAHLLGDDAVEVRGLVGTGMPWFTSTRFPGATIVTKPGSFGDPGTLADLLRARMSP